MVVIIIPNVLSFLTDDDDDINVVNGNKEDYNSNCSDWDNLEDNDASDGDDEVDDNDGDGNCNEDNHLGDRRGWWGGEGVGGQSSFIIFPPLR